MPWWCLGKVVRALNSQERALKGSKSLCSASPTRRTSTTPASRRAQVELLQGEGANVSYHDPNVPKLPEHGLTSAPLDIDGADCVVVTAHSGIDYDDLVERAKLVVDLRNATGANGAQNGRGLEAVSIRIGHAGLGYWGPNLAQLRRARRSPLALRPLSRPPRRARSAVSRSANHERFRRAPGRSGAGRGHDRDPGRDALRPGQAGAAGRQARLRGEAAGAVERRGGGAARAGRGAWAVFMPGYLLLYHPAVAKLKELIDAGEPAMCSTSTATGRTWARSGATRTHSGHSARTTCP